MLLGCGGFALLSCLVVSAVVGFGALKAKESLDGLVNRERATERAVKLLGAVPEGYVAISTFSIFSMMEMSVLAKGTELADGGLGDIEREFIYVSMINSDTTAGTKAYFKGTSDSVTANGASGTMVRASEVIKRGNFTVDSRKIYYIVSRGALEMANANSSMHDGEVRLNTSMLFDCPDDRLHSAVWSMSDPDPKAEAKSLDLTGTVGDEAQLVPFLKQLTPCS